MNSKTEEIVRRLRGIADEPSHPRASEFLDIAADRLEMLEAEVSRLKARQRWIPVTESLPEEGITVLTLDKRGHMRDRKLYTFRGGQRLFRPDGLAPGYDVLYWRSLPEPPKKEE